MANLREFYKRLRADCDTTAAGLRQQSVASADEINAHRPGGVNNPDKGPDGWLSFYRWLQRTHAASVRTGPRQAVREEEGDALDTLRGVPERVELLEPVTLEDAEAALSVVCVYPKSWTALVVCHELNLRLGYLSGHIERRAGLITVDELELTAAAWRRVQRYLSRLVWIVTHPAAGLPYDPVSTPDPEPPHWVTLLSSVDLHRIVAAYQQVNAVRLVALDKLVAPDPEAGQSVQRPSWSIFFTTAASELGIRERDLMDDYDLPGLVAKLRLNASAKRTAMEDAEARAKRQRGRDTPTVIPR